ncbi:MAG: ABC-F family ATP-binding cassette domain-containing protein [Chloroflexia bacterium]|nr:ABC-F family ATP-binding cassette domain-containing protein [Chloroflexia bacterium]
MLSVTNLEKRFADRLVFEQVGFTVNPGDRVGLVGPNGAGKTTLFAIIAGDLAPDSGAVTLTARATIGYLRQGFADRPEATLADLLDVPVHGLLAANRRLDEAAAALAEPAVDGAGDATLTAYVDALAAFEAAGGYAMLDSLETMLAALGLPGVDLATPAANLSGGEKTRAGLSALLARKPDLLLLDEPTNHLDPQALEWLEDFVAGYPGTIVVVSHDRAFLDRVATQIFELDDRLLTAYPGNYGDYLAAKDAAAEAQALAYGREQREISRVQEAIRKNAHYANTIELGTIDFAIRAKAKRIARAATVRTRRLERQLESGEMAEKPRRRWGLALDLGDVPENGRDVAILDGIDVTLGGKSILRGVDLHIRDGERVVLTGQNGAGKSTLLRLISGDLTPDAGSVRLGAGVVVGRFAQEQETVARDRTVLDQVRAVANISETDARNLLHLFLFGGDTVFALAGDLSYGERARLALALLTLKGANFLLLDEPLNHLDLQAREQFEEALTQYSGTLLMVLHDRYATERLATRVLAVEAGNLRQII